MSYTNTILTKTFALAGVKVEDLEDFEILGVGYRTHGRFFIFEGPDPSSAEEGELLDFLKAFEAYYALRC